MLPYKYLLIIVLFGISLGVKIDAAPLGILMRNYYPTSVWPDQSTLNCVISKGYDYVTLNLWVYPWGQSELEQLKASLEKCNSLGMICSVRIPIYYVRMQGNSPSVVMGNFFQNIPTNLYSFIWLDLVVDQGQDADCSTMISYIKQCNSRNKQCGFKISYEQWLIFSNYNPLYCPEMASQKLMFQGSQSDFKPIGGWGNFDFLVNPNEQTSLCPWAGHNFMIFK